MQLMARFRHKDIDILAALIGIEHLWFAIF